MRWLFLEDGSALQASHVTRLSWHENEIRNEFVVLAHLLEPPRPFPVSRHATKDMALEEIRNIIVGRSSARSHD
jgi:hypothetical protein